MSKKKAVRRKSKSVEFKAMVLREGVLVPVEGWEKESDKSISQIKGLEDARFVKKSLVFKYDEDFINEYNEAVEVMRRVTDKLAEYAMFEEEPTKEEEEKPKKKGEKGDGEKKTKKGKKSKSKSARKKD